MAHLNEGSLSVSENEHGDFILYPSIVEDGSLYPTQYPQTHYNTSTTDILYDSRSPSDIDFTTMMGEDMNSTPNSHSNKPNPTDYSSYLLGSAPATYPPQAGFILSTQAETYDFQSPSYNYNRKFFNTSTVEPSAIDVQRPRFLIHPATIPIGFPLEAGDYRSTPSASPATSIGGFEGASSAATHSSINSAIGSLSTRSSTRNSPYSVHEDLLQAGIDGAVEGLEQDQGYNCYINPSELSTQSNLVEEPASTVGSPNFSPISPPSSPSSPTFSRKNPSGRLSPFGSGRSHSNFPYPPRRDSLKSNSSSRGSKSPRLESSDETHRMRSPSSPTAQPAGRDAVCSECGKTFRDMRAHLLTHKMERPEKCPIATCEYSKKGFARKYDCQRHTLTHYKGTMVCGFCPCAGSPAEKSFNRADVFKRHLMSVHNVEQTPPNGRKKPSSSTSSTSQAPRSPSGRSTERFGEFQGSGKCSTCSGTFSTAQQFYEHLDDCVYSKVVQEEPAAAYNEMNLNQINLDDIADSLVSPWKTRRSKSENDEKVEEEEDEEDEERGDAEEDTEDRDEKDETWVQNRASKPSKQNALGRTTSTKPKTGTTITKIKQVRYRVSKLTTLNGNSKPRARRGGKKRKNFPAGWGCPPEQMISKRRCLMVYDGPNILCKDEMMMNTEWEVRASTGGDNFISDLDIWTMAKAKAALEAGINVEVR